MSKYRFVRIYQFFSIFMVALMLLSVLIVFPVYGKTTNSTSTDTTIPRVINIVYDDSGSMIPSDKNDQRWCSAMYALEVFTAMMGEKDTINIYRMSEYDRSNTESPVIKTIKGSDSSRVSQVHNMESRAYATTPIESVEAAAEDLKKVSSSNDRWLVILTDGDVFFSGGVDLSATETKNRLTNELNEYAREFKVAYLGIGSKAAKLDTSTVSTWTAKTGEEILSRVTEIGNGIFEHQVLPESYISSSGSSYKLSTDIPTKQIIIFAQGENVSIGDLKLNGTKISGEQLNVKYIDEGEKAFPKHDKADITNYRNLKGVVAVYDAADDPFSNGTFEVDVSGAAKVEFYYKAGVVPTCILYDEDGNVVNPEDGITAGEYKWAVGFVDPITGKPVSESSELIKPISKELKVINNGNEIDISGETITLEEGNVEISTSIELEGNVKADSFFEYKIKPKAIKLEIQLAAPEEPYKAQQLNEEAPPVIATLIDNTTGTVITQEQWDACKVKVKGNKDDKHIEWDIKKGSAVGTFEIRPISKSDKNVSKIESGKHYFELEVDLKFNDQKIEEKASGSITIEAYAGTTLVIVPETVDTPVRNPAIPDFPGIKATIYAVDDTGQQVPISEDVWNCLKVKAVKPKTKRVGWTVEKGTEVGTYIIKPDYPGKFFKFALFMYGAVRGREDYPEYTAPDGIVVNKVSNISTSIKATGELGPMTYSGEGIAQMKVAPLTGKEIWALVAKYVIGSVILLILIIGYSVKPRIQRENLGPHIVCGKAEVDCKIRIKNKFLPFTPEWAIVNNCNGTMKCNIPDMRIQAYTDSTFIILNAKEVLNKTIRINGQKVGPNNVSSFKDLDFAYDGFKMSPVAEAGKRVGMFHMTKSS